MKWGRDESSVHMAWSMLSVCRPQIATNDRPASVSHANKMPPSSVIVVYSSAALSAFSSLSSLSSSPV